MSRFFFNENLNWNDFFFTEISFQDLGSRSKLTHHVEKRTEQAIGAPWWEGRGL